MAKESTSYLRLENQPFHFMPSKPELQNLLEKNETEKLFSDLLCLAHELKNGRLENEIIHQSSRFEETKQEEMLGTISRENLDLNRNRIRVALSSIIDRIFELNEELTASFPYQVVSPSSNAESTKKLLREMKTASSALLHWKNTLSEIDECLERQVTGKIIDWIFKPIETKPDEEDGTKPIAVVHGAPGVGKSVIMRSLCERLQKEKVPTLGIRSELYRAENLDSLQKSLDFSNAIVETVQALTAKSPLVVVLIDQIDALSQSFSANRLFLDTYNRLIWELADLDKVRVIISSRTFDLNNDPALKEYAKSSSFEVLPLEKAQVEAVLGKLGVASSSLHPDFLAILGIPNNLDVFCQIHQKSTKLNQLKTLRDLYDERWQQAMERLGQYGKLDPDSVLSLAEEIARKLNAETWLSISTANFLFEGKVAERKWLVSEGILLERDRSVQFFHQTFYEYLFAKQFVRRENDLLNFIFENHQGLACRVSAKLILQFYRDFDLKAYLGWLRVLIFKVEVRFHFKHLALSMLANQPTPTELEKQFVMQEILPQERFGFLFLQLVTSSNWISLFIENGVAQQLAFPETKRVDGLMIHVPDEFGRGAVGNGRKRLQFMLRDYVKTNPLQVLTFYNSLPEFEEKPEIVADLLYMLEDWSSPIAIAFFEKYNDAVRRDVFLFFSILEHAVGHQFDWVLKLFKPFILNKEETRTIRDRNDHYSYHEKQLTELLFKHDRYRSFDFFLEILSAILEKEREITSEARQYYRSTAWFDSNPDDEFFGESGAELIFKKLVGEVRDYAVNDPERFLSIFETYRDSKFADFLSLLLHGIGANPENYVSETLALLVSVAKRGGLKAYQLNKVSYQIRCVLGKNAHLLTDSQWDSLKKILLTLLEKNDAWIDGRSATGKKKFRGYYGHKLMLYLQYLPKDLLKKDTEIWKLYLELDRKYKTIEDHEPGNIRVYSVPPPLTTNAYKKMTAKQWKNSFRKYDKDYEPPHRGDRGDSWQHRNEFQKCVQENPTKFISLIEDLIEDKNIAFMYVSAGLDGLREAKIDEPTFTRLLKMAINRKLDGGYDVNCLIRQMRFFAGQGTCDPELFDWLEGLILLEKIPEIIFKTKEEGTSEKDSPYKAVGSIVSDAVYEWIHLFRCKEQEERIFAALNKAVDYSWHEVRVSMVRAIPYLLSLNKEQSLELFRRAVEKMEKEVIDVCFYPLQKYFIWFGFDALIPFLTSLAKIEERQPDLAFTLAVQWIEGQDTAWVILKPILDSNPTAVVKMPELALRKLKEKREDILPRCYSLFEMFLEHPDDEVIKSYDLSLHRLKPEHFEIAAPILKTYKTAKAAKKIPAAFFNYLRMCASRYPEGVVELMDFWENYDSPDIFHEHYYRDEPMHILVALERLFGKDIAINQVKFNKVLDMVDKMLENPQLKGISNETLEKAEIGH